jgi:hypothetical protein
MQPEVVILDHGAPAAVGSAYLSRTGNGPIAVFCGGETVGPPDIGVALLEGRLGLGAAAGTILLRSGDPRSIERPSAVRATCPHADG